MLRLIAIAAVIVGSLSVVEAATPAGGNYTVVGGSPFERSQVVQALDTSTFNWSRVPGPVTINIGNVGNSHSSPGEIWLDAGLLDTGTFSWGVVQMEYAQQVQFSLLNDQQRTQFIPLLSARQWCYEDPSLPPGANACERFAATLAWAYWPSPQNSMEPSGADDWSASMEPGAFRALVASMIGDTTPVRRTASIKRADGSVLLTISVPAAGVATVTGRGIAPASVRAAAPGALTVWLRPTTPLRRAQFVAVSVTFSPTAGVDVHALLRVKLSPPSA